MRLSLVISTLTCGGAERVMTLLANEWVRRGNDVQLVTLDSEPPFFSLDGRVKLVQLGCERPSRSVFQSLWSLWSSVRALRSSLRAFRSEAVVAFTTRVNVKAVMASEQLGIPVVISERTHPSGLKLGKIWSRLVDRWYGKAWKLVVQSDDIGQYYRSRGLARTVVIPNPVEAIAATGPKNREFLWLAVARLHYEKGIDLLLRSWVLSVQSRTSRLRILGDGPERPALEALARDLGIASRVEFAGFVSDKLNHWSEASAFVLSSRLEGFPNALCEAMAAGLPCVSFDCPSGPAAVMRNEENGLLVPPEDVAALAAALDRIVDNPPLRQRLAAKAAKITDVLGLPGIVDRWEAALRS